ncbi:DUF6602 domain-containing protein [Paraburkholderia acidipaludis]|uniref:DUF6602 domain-containing protein n=1 Tax=Paraburkholderia acidipaludis TaxID=660537 RepID=UPI0012ECA983|nr:DUF6602 domain-containing protein [Paraburkholderia acidipaludis]
MSAKLHDLHVFMSQVTEEMASEYRRIFSRAPDDPGTAGDEVEENWAKLLREWLPPHYHVRTKGRLLGYDGTMSPQIDVVVLKPSYPTKLLDKKIWLAQGVAAAFECKTTLRSDHILDSANRCVQFKNLFKPRTGSPRLELSSALVFGVLAHSHAWKAEGSRPVDNVNRVLAGDAAIAPTPAHAIDLICVADLATWWLIRQPRVDIHEGMGDPIQLRGRMGGNWAISTAMCCASLNSEGQHPGFQPVGALLAQLIQRLAWDDPAVRDFADYFRLAKLWGANEGPQRLWPRSIYSEPVRDEVEKGNVYQGLDWSGWSCEIN